MGEGVRPDDRLVPLHGDARVALDERRQLGEPVEPKPRVDAVEEGEARRDLLERRVARPLADAVHGRRDVLGAVERACDGVRRRKAEVVVAVHLDGDAVARQLHDREDEADRLRRRGPRRVHQPDPVDRALGGERLKEPLEQAEVGARRVVRAEDDVEARSLGVRADLERPPKVLVVVDVDLGRALPRADGHAQADGVDAARRDEVDVARGRPTQRARVRAEAEPDDRADGRGVVLRDGGRAELEVVDAERGERRRDLDLLLDREDDARLLLAVPERAVGEAGRPTVGRRVLEARAGPRADGRRLAHDGLPGRST